MNAPVIFGGELLKAIRTFASGKWVEKDQGIIEMKEALNLIADIIQSLYPPQNLDQDLGILFSVDPEHMPGQCKSLLNLLGGLFAFLSEKGVILLQIGTTGRFSCQLCEAEGSRHDGIDHEEDCPVGKFLNLVKLPENAQ
jgi:hypothetical protein